MSVERSDYLMSKHYMYVMIADMMCLLHGEYIVYCANNTVTNDDIMYYYYIYIG